VVAEMVPAPAVVKYGLPTQPSEWTPEEVHAFVEAALPSHPCVSCFRYISGYVLLAMTKEDLQRQARDAEAADELWEALERLRHTDVSPGQLLPASVSRAPVHVPAIQSRGLPNDIIIIFVKTPAGTAVELEAYSDSTVGDLKNRLAELEGRMTCEGQRLILDGHTLEDAKSLEACKVRHGSLLRLVPVVKDFDTWFLNAPNARRGLLMVPSPAGVVLETWSRLLLPLICNDGPLVPAMFLELSNDQEKSLFVDAASRVRPRPLIEILPEGPEGRSLRVEAAMSGSNLRVETRASQLAVDAGLQPNPTDRRRVVLHLDGRVPNIANKVRKLGAFLVPAELYRR